MSQVDQDIAQIFDFLVDQEEFRGTQADLGVAVEIPERRVHYALYRIRAAEFIAENEWTVPNVRKGAGEKVWSIAERPSDADAVRMGGMRIRLPEVLETAKRLRAQIELGSGWADGRTAEGRRWRRAGTMIEAAEEALAMAYESSDGASG